MKETYLSRDFRETAAQCFPSQAKELNAFFDARLNVLLAENADASKEKQYHLQRQILPGVAAYETLQRVMPKEEALQTVHGYVEELARTSHKQLCLLYTSSLFHEAGRLPSPQQMDERGIPALPTAKRLGGAEKRCSEGILPADLCGMCEIGGVIRCHFLRTPESLWGLAGKSWSP